MRGRLEDAEDALREVLRSSRETSANCNGCPAQYRRGDKNAALDSANQGLEIDPQHVNCLNSRGQYLRALGKLEGFWKSLFARVLKLEPENAFTHANLG